MLQAEYRELGEYYAEAVKAHFGHRLIYDDGFLAGVLEDIRKRLKQLGARKVTAKKGYYWVLTNAKPTEVVEI
jgi:hypothetical protein